MGLAEVFQLIVTTVAREKTEAVLDAIEKEGANKSTVLLGRRISDDNPILFRNLKIDPQREVIYTLVPKQQVDLVFEVILAAGELNNPRNGFAFVLDVAKAGGIN